MLLFEGYLASWTQSPAGVVARFVSGDTDPSPAELPVLEVVVSSDEGAVDIIQSLSQLKDDEAWLYISYEQGDSLQIESEFGRDYTIRGSSLKVERSAYQSADFQRLARVNFERANEERLKNRALTARLARVQALLDEQQSRIVIKASGHATGTTARTLYEQHLSFLSRLRTESEA